MPGKSPSNTISEAPTEELAELAAVLSSKTFSRAYNQTAILTYICQEYAQGHGGAIKEYTVAVSALGRKTDFDPATDSVVRVEVSRLRKRLRQYYASEGASHEIEIRLPEVGYSPHFVRRDRPGNGLPVAAATELEELPVRVPFVSPSVSTRRGLIAAAGLLIVAVGFGAVVMARHRLGAGTVPVAPSFVVPVPATTGIEPLRIAAGSSNPRYVDRSGQFWLGDRYFTGGNVVSKPDHRILRTFDPYLYQEAREGEFQYDVPLKSGVYELHLHFAEIVHREALGSGVDGQRRFNVTANGKPLLSSFDIVLDAPGADVADERVFKDISPAPDGSLHLRFTPVASHATVSGIEIIPSSPHRLLPIRILAASRALYDRADHLWSADRYFFGGRSLPRLASVRGTDDPGIFAGERFGSFSYFIPVAEGRYSVTFRFAESNYGVDNIGLPPGVSPAANNRVFNIYCNGVALARNFEIYKEAGGPLKALVRSFQDLRPNAQGKLVFSFEPVADYPTISAIEVLDESR